MSNNNNLLYVIVRDIDEYDADDKNFWENLQIFTNLKDALKELNNINKMEPLFKYYNYHIKTYIKINNKYILSHQTYYYQKCYS